MKTVHSDGEDVSTQIQDVAVVRTDYALVEVTFNSGPAPLGPLHVFAAPKMPNDARLPACGCNPFVGRTLARSIDDVRRLRDALSLALTVAEAGR